MRLALTSLVVGLAAVTSVAAQAIGLRQNRADQFTTDTQKLWLQLDWAI